MASAEFIGSEIIKRKLQAMLMAKSDGLKAAGLVVLTKAQKTITSGGGNGWPGFKRPPTRAHQLLWDYGTLLRSLTVGDTNNVFEQDDASITIGSNVAYARAQNLGDPNHNLPARPFLFLDNERMDLAKDAYLAQIKKAWDR